MSKSNKNNGFIRFNKSKILAAQECYSLKTRGFSTTL